MQICLPVRLVSRADVVEVVALIALAGNVAHPADRVGVVRRQEDVLSAKGGRKH